MDWNWSFRAFRLFGTDVRIHWSLPAFFLYFVLRAASHGTSPTFLALFVVTPFVLLFASVLAHEYGHIFAARWYGLHVGRTILTPIGGMVMVGQAQTPKSELVVAAAGPAVNLALALLGTLFYALLGGPFSASLVVPLLGDDLFARLYQQGDLGTLMVRDFVQTNAMLWWFNVLMVAYPLDGGRMLFSALWKRHGYQTGMVLACKVSRVLAVVLGIAAIILLSPILAVIAFFVWLQATMVLRQIPQLAQPGLGSSGGIGRARWPRAKPRQRGQKRGLGGLRDAVVRWHDRREAERYLELVAKAEMKGLHALSDDERAFLKQYRERRFH